MPIRELAETLGVTDTTIYRRAEEWGLPPRDDPGGRAERNRVRRAEYQATIKAEKKAKAAADKLIESILPQATGPQTPDERIRATGGVYRKLETLAAELGMSLREINYRWHQVRRTAVGTVNAKRNGRPRGRSRKPA